ncbi:MAG TPA: LysR family transcriptional regulator [Methylomirabilota bacterium]|nr:LysR family transcriptional regulator [Methylomirabilota bacterium]
MHLETLRLYCDVVRLRSFSRGADLNFVSQSAASQAVQQLEGQLGVALIDRTKRPFVVTPQGEAFYDAARGILEGWEKAKTEVAAVKARVDGTVRVAAIYSVGLHDVSRPMQQFMSLYPEAHVQLECLHPHKVVEAVLTGEADIGIMSYPPADRALSVVPLREEPMALVCHPNHRLARRRVVMPAELGGEPFVAFDPDLTIRKAIDRTLRQHNVRPNIVMEFDNIETIKQAIIIAAGISILPRHTVQKEASIRTLAAVDLAIADLVRPVGIVHRRQKPLTPTAERFVQMLKDASEAPRAAVRERVPAPAGGDA